MGSNAFNKKKKGKKRKKEKRRRYLGVVRATPKWLNECGRQDPWGGSANP